MVTPRIDLFRSIVFETMKILTEKVISSLIF